MKHFVFYERAESVGAFKLSEEPFSVIAKLGVKDLVGNALWVIRGEGDPRQYFLYSVFIVKNLNSIVIPKGRYLLEGTDGISFSPPIRIDQFGWFKLFMKNQRNFSMGVREIRERESIMQLKNLAQAASNLPAGIT
jgi:hypothetical protein